MKRDRHLRIIAFIPAGTDINSLKDTLLKYKIDFKPVANNSVADFVGKNSNCYWVSNENCDCGTPLGCQRKKQVNHNCPSYQQVSLSINKIVCSSEKSEEQVVAGMSQIWIDFVKAFIQKSNKLYFGILLHSYSESLNERVVIHNTRTVLLTDVTANLMMNLDEDVIYYFVNSPDALIAIPDNGPNIKKGQK